MTGMKFHTVLLHISHSYFGLVIYQYPNLRGDFAKALPFFKYIMGIRYKIQCY